jgi:hypothetical protein
MSNYGGMVIPEEISMIVSSDPAAGAINISPDGSYFEIQLQDGLQIPKEALNINIAVEEATVWWVVPNIITGENDKMYITGPDVGDVVQNYVVTIPQGLYDLSGINQAILRELENQGAKIDPDPLITLTPDEPTQKVEIRFSYPTVSVDFTQADTPRDILGFNSQVLGPYPGAPVSILADNVAAFNQINYFLIHSDLTNKGIRFNNNYSQTIAQVLIDVPPGSQIVSTPQNPAKINAPELGGAKRTNLRVWLTDDKDRRVNTNGEYFTARIVIHYLKPYVISRGLG